MKTIILSITLSFINAVSLLAQSSDSEQKSGQRAPYNVKIDGKLNEWIAKPFTYSHHTQFYYTVSNDDRYFYLTIRTEYAEIVNRIMKGGITLTINKSDKRKDPGAIHVTYPVIDHFTIRFQDAPKVKEGSAATAARLDTFVNEVNTKLESRAKMIKVAGIMGVDTLISIYNLDGIKAVGVLDNKMHYNYELAVSLANLGLDINNPQKFMYQVMINETEDKTTHGIFKGSSGESISFTVTTPATSAQPATDFWGEYTLAR